MDKKTVDFILGRIKSIDGYLKNIHTNHNTDPDNYENSLYIGYELEEIKDALKKATESI